MSLPGNILRLAEQPVRPFSVVMIGKGVELGGIVPGDTIAPGGDGCVVADMEPALSGPDLSPGRM
jgi:hypothetical protein